MGNDSDIMVSICCTVFNHEKYLRKCLDGFIEQKTNFKYEVLIHDDASTDSSADIIREYEAKYPDIIKTIYQTENQYSKGVKISWNYLYPRAKGKYIALCEGDDYWSSPYKLQLQFNALEKQKKCVFCSHKVRFISEDGKPINQYLPRIIDKSIILNKQNWMRMLSDTNFQTSSYFFRRDAITKYIDNIPHFLKNAPVGDIPLMLLLAIHGDCAYIDKEMSCYRRNAVGSWTNSLRNNKNKAEKHENKMIEMLESYNKFSNYIFVCYINDMISYHRFQLECINNNYKEVFKKKYSHIIRKLPLIKLLLYRAYACFPSLRTLYLRMRYKQ